MTPFLRLDNISYMKDLHSTLRSISLDLEQGRNIVFFGLENSGIDKICPILSSALLDFDGDVIFKGQSLKNANYVQRNIIRRDMVYLQRGYGLISNMSVEENISLPLRYHSRFTSSEIAERVDALIEEMGLDIYRDMRPVDLHQSEQLKTAYARAVALDPSLLLCEHPLDSQCVLNISAVLASLRRWAESDVKSVIVVTFMPRIFTEIGDRFIMLYHGEVVFDGDRDDFRGSENPYLRQYLSYSTEGPMAI